MPEDRDLSFDAFRGIAIIAVIAIHSIDSLFPWQSPATVWQDLFLVATYRQFLNFAVPSFIFISGYWASKKSIISPESYKTFLRRRLSRVLVPYLFWSVILLGFEAFKTHNVDAQQIAFKLLTGRAISVYFFIIVITQLYLLTPLLQCINRNSYGLMLILVFNIVSLLFAYLSRLYLNFWIPVSSAFYVWIIFYEAGLLIGKNSNRVFTQKKIRPFILPAILVTLLISGLETTIILLKYGYVYFAISPTKYSSFLYSACVIIGFLFVKERIKYWPKSLVLIGNCSFGIYLIHMPVLNQVANLVQKSDKIYSFQPLYEFTTIVLTLLICLAIIGIMRRILPKPFWVRILGF
ncbi:MAG: acyltransferase [Sedimentisphaerales bacterium]|nr:acyltransferase [Sedimentisphaerales bacterium]